MIDQIRRIGWLAVEVAVLVIVLCVLLNILLGNEGGSFISFVSDNATKFLQALPPGVTLGISLIVSFTGSSGTECASCHCEYCFRRLPRSSSCRSVPSAPFLL